MKNLRGKVVVVTGAASGIGRALALKLARHGASLALCDINGRDLERVSWDVQVLGSKVFHQVMDVSSLEQWEVFRQNILRTFGSVDVVINNAGVSLSETVLQSSLENTNWLLDINMYGVIHGSRIFLRDLLQQKESVIVNISSIFGVIGIPSQSAYCASKFAVRGFTESLRAELLGSTVKVVLILPGGIKTNIVRNGRHFFNAKGDHVTIDDISKKFDSVALTSPETVADVIVRSIQKPSSFRVVVGLDAKLIDALARFFPSFVNRLAAWVSVIGSPSSQPQSQSSAQPTEQNKKVV